MLIFLSVLQGCFYSAFLLYNLDFILLWNIVLMPSIFDILSLEIQSVLGAIWPSLSPCTVINPILLTYVAGAAVSTHSTTQYRYTCYLIIREIYH